MYRHTTRAGPMTAMSAEQRRAAEAATGFMPAAEGLVENTPGAGDEGEAAGRRADVARVLAEMTPRYRQLLWMAYVEGASHVEIAQVVGLKSQSVRPLLFRAREKMLALLKKHGLAPAGEGDR